MTMTMVDGGPEQAGISYVCIQFLYFLKCLFWRENITLFLQVGLRGQAEQREQASVCAGICYMFFVFFVFYFVFFAGGFGFERAGSQARVCAGRRNSVAGRTPARQESEQSADGARKSQKGSAADTQVCLLRVPSSTSGLEITQ